MDAGEKLGSLGWRGDYSFDHPDVAALRSRLLASRPAREHADELEIVDPNVEGFACRAAELLQRDGYAIVSDVLAPDIVAGVQAGLERIIRGVVAHDPLRTGNRGSHRYAITASTVKHFGAQTAWATLLDRPALLRILAEVFRTDEFVASNEGSPWGGFHHCDFCLPGALDFQHLHSDGAAPQDGQYRDVKLCTRENGTVFWREIEADNSKEEEEHEIQDTSTVNLRDIPIGHFGVTVNFPMELGGDSHGGQSTVGGPTRLVAGTQHSKEPIPFYSQEPLSMKLSMAAPLPLGCAVLRDCRAWHGGCPNVSRSVRALLGVGYHVPGRGPAFGTTGLNRVVLSREAYALLSLQGQHVCRELVIQGGEIEVDTDWNPPTFGFQHTEAGFVNTGAEAARLAKL
jgi:hypothetical protein